MSDVASVVQEPIQPITPSEPVQQDVNQLLASSLWGTTPPAPEPIAPQTPDPGLQQQIPASPVNDDTSVIDVDEYFKTHFGLDSTTAKNEWETYQKSKQNPPSPSPELKFENDESKRVFDLFKQGKINEIREYLNQQDRIQQLETYDINNAQQAAEIIKANLQFKHKGLSPQQIDRLFERQYAMPSQPQQGLDQSDEDYQSSIEAWKKQIQEKEQDLIIDATLAKPELSTYKSQIVLPDIPQAVQPSAGPTPEELAAAEAGRNAYLQAVNSNYQNFKGFSVTAKDGDVQLPVEYLISPEELTASKQSIENLNVDEFFAPRWFDENGNPRVTVMQEDLYLLQNRDKIFQKIANEAAAQRYLHHQKIQNNINLNGVNNIIAPSTEPVKTDSQVVAEQIWKF